MIVGIEFDFKRILKKLFFFRVLLEQVFRKFFLFCPVAAKYFDPLLYRRQARMEKIVYKNVFIMPVHFISTSASSDT
jgi:hypothetical protein